MSLKLTWPTSRKIPPSAETPQYLKLLNETVTFVCKPPDTYKVLDEALGTDTSEKEAIIYLKLYKESHVR